MALPKIDSPVFELDLPLSKKHIRFRPFLVKEQKNLMMAMEADDKETVERNIRQVLHNCTLNDDVVVDELPVIDVEYFFLHLRARSVGEIVENKYICTNEVNGQQCGNKMETKFNLLDVQVEMNPENKDVIQLTDKISIKMKYPAFSITEKLRNKTTAVDVAFEIIIDSIEWIFDGEQYHYASESTPKELMEFVETLNQDQFGKLEKFFDTLPKLNKTIEVKCNKCGFEHTIATEGLENFFG